MKKITKEDVFNLIQPYNNIYLYGGFVRDYLLGLPNRDYDVVTDNNTLTSIVNTLSQKYKIKKITREKDVYTYKTDSELQFITLRGNSVEIHGLHYTDFTMNALFMNKYGKIFDPTGYGEFDLKCGVIRCIDPERSIAQDPIRILRAIRFAVQYDFTIHKDLEHVMHEKMHLLFNDITYQYGVTMYILFICEFNKAKAFDLFKKFRINIKRRLYDII